MKSKESNKTCDRSGSSPLEGEAGWGGATQASPSVITPDLNAGLTPPSQALPTRGRAFLSISPPAFILLTLITLYRHTLSAFLGRSCRFLPTCSAYAEEAIRIHGAAKGSRLAFKRICRCHPFTRLGGGSGFDPVPEVVE